MKSKGFTFIELLVVVALISLLTSVILAALKTAKDKSEDSSIKSNLANIRAQAAIYYNDPDGGNGTYGLAGNCGVNRDGVVTVFLGSCSGVISNQNFASGVRAAAIASGQDVYVNIATDPSASWVVWAKLKVASNSWHCVDSLGSAKLLTTAPGAGITICP